MRHFLTALFLFGFSCSLMAHESQPKVHAADAVTVQSSLVVQGTIVVKRGKHPSSAVVNQQPVWQGMIYSYNPKTGKFSPRAKKDSLPSVTILKVENGKVTFFYVDEDHPKGITFTRNLKKPAKPKTGKRI